MGWRVYNFFHIARARPLLDFTTSENFLWLTWPLYIPPFKKYTGWRHYIHHLFRVNLDINWCSNLHEQCETNIESWVNFTFDLSSCFIFFRAYLKCECILEISAIIMYGMQWDIIQASLQATTINALWRATPLQVPLPRIHVIFV